MEYLLLHLVVVIWRYSFTLVISALSVISTMIRVAGPSLVTVTTALNAGLDTLTVLGTRHLFAGAKDLFEFAAIIEPRCSTESDKTSLRTKAIID